MSRPGEPTQLAVVIPARNEQDHLPACLAALELSVQELQKTVLDSPPVRVVLVLDSCTDRSAEIAAATPWVSVLTCALGRVGAVRAHGIDWALRHDEIQGGQTPGFSWIACTDADSQVPADWLITQLRHARAGTDLLLGTVRPDTAEASPVLLERWLGLHELADEHPHVHGANLGVRSDVYQLAGGFLDVPEHEDRMLTQRLRARGATVVSTGCSPVITSARTHGRTPGGMAGYLLALSAGLVLDGR